jgi:cytochrome c biogenesis protein CcmG/thiol:disulfide interchange protein DsbE
MSPSTPHKSRKFLYFGAFWTLVAFGVLMIYGLRKNPYELKNPLLGKQAQGFVIPSLIHDKEEVYAFDPQASLASNTWTVMNFWTSTCFVCQKEAFELQTFYEQSKIAEKPYKVQFLSVNISDRPHTILAWQKRFQQNFPVLMDTQGKVSVMYGVTGTPETFFISPSGVISYHVLGEAKAHLIFECLDALHQKQEGSL